MRLAISGGRFPMLYLPHPLSAPNQQADEADDEGEDGVEEIVEAETFTVAHFSFPLDF